MIVALIHAGDVNLTKWSMYIPCRGKFAQSRQRRIQRWLNNPRINIHRIYKSLVRATLSNWSESKIFLALDTSLFGNEYCLVRLSVIHRGRALPLVWRVMEHESSRIKSNTWIWKGNWCQPKNFHLNCGEAICLHNVQIHKGEFYGKVHVIIARKLRRT